MSSQHNSVSNARLDVPGQDRLIVCLADALRKTGIAAALEQEQAVAEIVPTQRLVAALQAQAANRALIVYDRPAAYLCQRMIDGTSPADALTEWKATAATLADILQTYRDRVWLIDLDMLAQYPSLLGDRLGLSAATSTMLKNTPPPAQDPVLRMLAGAVVRREMSAQILAGELEASALNLSNRDRSDAVDGMQAFEHYAQQRKDFEVAKAESVAQTLYAEEMFTQLEIAQAETAARLVELEAARTETAARKAELETGRLALEKMQQRQVEMDSELARMARDGTALKSAQTALMQQLDQAQRDLEARYGQIRAKSAELETERHRYKVLAQEKADVDNWIHGIQASITYRMMNPLRRLRLLLKRKGADG
ncbi:hypothetical protein [Sulfitobacter sp.]|uniref:hypothetical protein n=1 Tax=Sulfitobacter sp. TaxID=1903071 RepID=UPI00300153FB